MTYHDAKDFFSDFFGGEHHLPSEIKEFGPGGWCIGMLGELATFDFNQLTRLVFMAHDRAVRVSVMGHGMSRIRITIFNRDRSGHMYQRHPTLAEALSDWRETHGTVKV